jgi:hypothetical protein
VLFRSSPVVGVVVNPADPAVLVAKCVLATDFAARAEAFAAGIPGVLSSVATGGLVLKTAYDPARVSTGSLHSLLSEYLTALGAVSLLFTNE